MRRFQYFIDFDGTVRIDNKDDDYRPETPHGRSSPGYSTLFAIYFSNTVKSFGSLFLKQAGVVTSGI